MEDKIKVSIIMPVYNAVQYIDTAITSVLSQTYTNFELIIVDDGATDGTSEICKNYSIQDARIKYIRQSNGGICKARNKGIELATGKYIAFSDHDDEYQPDYLELMVKKAVDDDLDIIKCGVYFDETYSDGKRIVREETFKEEIWSQKDLVKRYISLPVAFGGVWNTLYRASILQMNGIRFPEFIYHGQEDFYFNTELILYINNIGFINKCLYRHYRRLSQSTSAKFYEDRIDAMCAFFRLEQKVLKPFFNGQDWKKVLSAIYSQKIAGILSYCFRTANPQKERNARLAIEKFMNVNHYEYGKSVLSCALHTKNIKYFLVLYLAVHRYYRLLFYLWKIKNK